MGSVSHVDGARGDADGGICESVRFFRLCSALSVRRVGRVNGLARNGRARPRHCFLFLRNRVNCFGTWVGQGCVLSEVI